MTTPNACPACGHVLASDRAPLTLRQQEALTLVRKSIDERGVAPTLRELRDAMGVKSDATVHELLRALEAKGYVRRDPQRPRGMTLLDGEEARDREVIMLEAFMTGRIYAAGGEKEKPAEIHDKLRQNCERAVRRSRAAAARERASSSITPSVDPR